MSFELDVYSIIHRQQVIAKTRPFPFSCRFQHSEKTDSRKTEECVSFELDVYSIIHRQQVIAKTRPFPFSCRFQHSQKTDTRKTEECVSFELDVYSIIHRQQVIAKTRAISILLPVPTFTEDRFSQDGRMRVFRIRRGLTCTQ